MAVRTAGLLAGLYNRSNFSDGHAILEPANWILPVPYYEIDIKTRVKNAEYF